MIEMFIYGLLGSEIYLRLHLISSNCKTLRLLFNVKEAKRVQKKSHPDQILTSYRTVYIQITYHIVRHSVRNGAWDQSFPTYPLQQRLLSPSKWLSSFVRVWVIWRWWHDFLISGSVSNLLYNCGSNSLYFSRTDFVYEFWVREKRKIISKVGFS